MELLTRAINRVLGTSREELLQRWRLCSTLHAPTLHHKLCSNRVSENSASAQHLAPYKYAMWGPLHATPLPKNLPVSPSVTLDSFIVSLPS